MSDGRSGAVFCDHNAGGPVAPEVLERFLTVERECPGNPASQHAPGRRARAVLEQARQQIADAFEVAAADVVFTSGGTEAANLAVLGLGEPSLPVQVSPAEHPAVLEPAQLRGARWWTVDAEAAVQLTEPEPNVGLLCLVHAQGEVGTLQPVLAAAAMAARRRLPLFVDAAQTLGRVAVEPVVAAGAIVALSPHKAGGLRGHGVLLGHDLHARLRPLLRGGGQELGHRPGTQSPSLAAANALAIVRALTDCASRGAHMAAVRCAFLAALGESGVQHDLLTPLTASLPNTAMLCFPHVDGRNLMPALDLAAIHASHGAACSSGAPTPPRILVAIGRDDVQARACVRFSFGANDDCAALHAAGHRVGELVLRLQKKNCAG
ncbi:MAG: aminotransferase class V-fold PLP-dependent enzyme [Planctomycetes bacterium]|nr:aminotransferase class V-fold PLP-dependent enzyme [Planctomycetota bacterium]